MRAPEGSGDIPEHWPLCESFALAVSSSGRSPRQGARPDLVPPTAVELDQLGPLSRGDITGPAGGAVASDVVRGVVFIAPTDPVPADGSMIDPSTGRFGASWQDQDEPAELEGVEVVGAEAAIRWGRERANKVLIRLGNGGDTYFSAGSVHAEDEGGPLPLWPPRGAPASGWWEPIEVPPLDEIKRVSAEVVSEKRSPRDAAHWAIERLGPAIEADASEEIQAALMDLVQLGPPGLHRFS